MLAHADELLDHAADHVANVVGPLPDRRVRGGRKNRRIVLEHLPQGACAVAVFGHVALDSLPEGLILQDHDMRREHIGKVIPKTLTDGRAQIAELTNRLTKRALNRAPLSSPRRGGLIAQ